MKIVKHIETLLVSAVILSAGCGAMYPEDDNGSEVDRNIGLGSTHNEQIDSTKSDPCQEDNLWDCSPVSNEGCADAGVDLGCGYFSDLRADGGSSKFGFFCLTDATEPVGAACNIKTGPWCMGGATCVVSNTGDAGTNFDGTCAAYCCKQSDCEAQTICSTGDWPGIESSLGYCLP